ncbi:kinase-like protein [Ceratobasidium sp. AG-I]|nr:kinase-like protein [Ceratobasidium sp. AG-I]
MTPLSSITSTVYGKSRWRCPEYYKDRGENYIPPPTAASDIWSFGCVIVNIFLRELPFFTTDETEYVTQLNGGIAPYSQEQLANLDGRILVVVQDMLARDPKARPSARDVLKNIAAIM